MTSQELTLFVLRHGEREDEAMERMERKEEMKLVKRPNTTIFSTKYHEDAQKQLMDRVGAKMKNVDTLDPRLTVNGHHQAQESWTEILNVIQGRKVAVFSSPLRRAMGTAMMVGGATSSSDTMWSRPDGAASDNREIPITVLNGLGNFASAVYRRGGVDESFVPSASLPCADMIQNDGTMESPLIRALLSMPSHEVKATGKCPTKVRFWGKASSKRTSYRPISPSFHPASKRYKKEAQGQSIPYPKKPAKEAFISPIDPIGAIEDAIRMTAAKGCDVCIVVVHREAIRDLANCKCRVDFDLSTPYCSVGSFGVVCEGKNIRFCLSDVWSAGRQPKTLLRLPYAPPINLKYSRLMYRHHDPRLTYLCDIDTDLRDGHLGSQIWLSPFKSADFHMQSRKVSWLEFRVVDNREKRWEHFLRFLNWDEVLVGETIWLRNDGREYPVVFFKFPSTRSTEFAVYQA